MCVCVFFYLLHHKYQNTYSTSKVRTFLALKICLGVRMILSLNESWIWTGDKGSRGQGVSWGLGNTVCP